MRRIIGADRRPGLVLRDRQALGPPDHHRLRAPRRLAGGADGGRPDALRRRLDRARLGKDHALRGPRADLSPAGGAPGGLPRLPDRAGRGEGGHDPLRHARGHARSCSRRFRGARSSCARSSASPGRCTRIPRATACASPGRRPSGARCRSPAAWRRPTAAEIEAAPDPAAKRAEIEQRIRKFASPMRGAERYDIEEIIDPRDTRTDPLRIRRTGRAAAHAGAQQLRRSSLNSAPSVGTARQEW